MQPTRWLGMILALVLLAATACDRQPETDEAAPEPEDRDQHETSEPEPDPEPEPPPEPDPPTPDDPEDETVGAYGVSAGHPAAVDAGMAVLDAGGNAVDAAVATAYAVSVVEPFASGIGGGGAALVAEPGDDPVAYDYREVVADGGTIPANDTGVPGFVAGMEELHTEHGTGDVGRLLEPAIILAADGVETSAMLADQLRSGAGRLPVAQLAHFFPAGAALETGAPLVQGELAATLEAIAEEGAAVLYEGELAGELAARVDGLDPGSLAGYEVARPPPATGEFAGYEVVGAGPPLPGATIVQMLQVAEALGIEDHEPGSADFTHSLAMAWRLSEQFLLWELGDPSFVDVPLDELTDPQRNAELAEQVPSDGMLDVDPDRPAGGLDGNTTHLTVVDADGMTVSMTNTLTSFWGSGQYELGFFLNDQLARFDVGYGDANAPAPGKRSVSWSAPAMVLDADGRPVLGLGTPGGRRIPNVVSQVVARWAAHGQALEEAVDAPRFHGEGTVLEFEEPPPPEVAQDLRARGYSSLAEPAFPYHFGSVQALEIDYETGELSGAADTRREADWRVAAP